MNRSQSVRVGSSCSRLVSVTSGVPQGTVLGPLLFLLFAADIPRLLESFILMFADDTKLFRIVSETSSSEILQGDLDTLQNWVHSMSMRFHPLKCKVLHLGSRNPCANYFMYSDNGPVQLEAVPAE